MIDVYKAGLAHVGKIIAGTRPDQMKGPTPCTDYNVRQLINHIIGGAYLTAEVAAGKTIEIPAELPDFAGADASAAFEEAKKAAIASLDAPGSLDRVWHYPWGDMPGTMGIGIPIGEAFIHGWDLAKATGQDGTIESGIATALLEGAKKAIPDAMRGPGQPFGPIVPVPDSASPTEKLVAFYGRKP